MNESDISRLQLEKEQLKFEVERLKESNKSIVLNNDKITDEMRSLKQERSNESTRLEEHNKAIFRRFEMEHLKKMRERNDEFIFLVKSSIINVRVFIIFFN
jgi:hypothetical protein